MMMSEIITKTKSLAENDQSIANADITGWVDDAIGRINQAMKSNIPTTGGNTTTLVPAFDVRFHEALVIFAVAKYRESDSDYQSAQYFLGTFDDMLKIMQRDMTLLPSVRVDNNVQQIVVPNTTTFIFTLVMDYGSYFDNISVYNNDVLVDEKYYKLDVTNRQITFIAYTFATNDKVTILFENNSDLSNPPYQWWGNSGW
jgi:hypothetical protein